MTLEIPKVQKDGSVPDITVRHSRWAALEKRWSAVPSLFKHQNLWAALLLLAILLAFYRDVAFFGRTFLMENTTAGTMPYGGGFGYPGPDPQPGVAGLAAVDPGAIAWEGEPYNRRAGQIVQNGEIPLWNSSEAMGGPLLADGASGALEPIQLLFYFLPTDWWAATTDIQVLLRFFVAGFFTYLFIRLMGLRWLPAVFGGSVFMLLSYFVEFGNHPQVKAEILIPVLLYTYERLFRKPKIVVFSACALAIAWILTAAMPEAGFLGLFLANCWYLYRLIWEAKDSRFSIPVLRRLILNVVIATGLGLALSAFFVWPLLENISDSMHIHEPGGGLIAEPGYIGLLAILPNITTQSIWGAHFYSVVLMLATLGLFTAAKLGKPGRAVFFFVGFGLIFFLKIYGFPPLQWIGNLPYFSQTLLTKYPIPSIGLCFSICAGFGIQAILTKKAGMVRFLLVVGLLVGLAGTFYSIAGHQLPKIDTNRFTERLIMIGAIAFAIFVVILSIRLFKFRGQYLAYGLLIIAVLEPIIMHGNVARPLRYDPYTLPPFVKYLYRDQEPYRVLGLKQILYPEVATAYNIDDIRFLAPLTSERRFLFLTQFITPGQAIPRYLLQPGQMVSDRLVKQIATEFSKTLAPSPYVGELVGNVTRFTGTEPFLYLGKYFDLLNTKYILTLRGVMPGSYLNLFTLPGVPEQMAQPPKVVRGTGLTLKGEPRAALMMQPDSQLNIPVLLPAGKLSLQFGIGLDPTVCDPAKARGDGVTYRIMLDDDQGEHQIFNRYIDPKHNPAECRWLDNSVDLSNWSGIKVRLRFLTEAGPAGNRDDDLAYWSDPFVKMQNEPTSWLNLQKAQSDVILLNTPIINNNLSNSLLSPNIMTIAGEKHLTLYTHPNTKMTYPVKIPTSGAQLKFSIGLDPVVWKSSGDGVGYHLAIQDENGEKEIYYRYIDPKRNKAEQRWLDEQLDLSRWAGKTITLAFSTDTGPANNSASDWAHWGDVQLVGANVREANPGVEHFEMMYDKEVQIYRNNYAYPRAFIVFNVEPARDFNDALRHLARSDFNPSTQAVVEGDIPLTWSNALLNSDPATAPQPVEFTRRSANSIEMQADVNKLGLLVISNTYNRGWKAYVDGVATPVVPTDSFLCGVYVSPGKHVIKLAYEPDSFSRGVMISLSAAAVMVFSWLIPLVLRLRRKSRGVAVRESNEEIELENGDK